jgi:hypothetical protein
MALSFRFIFAEFRGNPERNFFRFRYSLGRSGSGNEQAGIQSLATRYRSHAVHYLGI